MLKKDSGTRTILSLERLGDEKRIRAILADWGTGEAAIERMLDEHHAREAKARTPLEGSALNDYPMTGKSTPVTHPRAHTVR